MANFTSNTYQRYCLHTLVCKTRCQALVLYIIFSRNYQHGLMKWKIQGIRPITYKQSDLFYMGLIKNLCGIKTMHAMEEQFNEKNCIDTLRILSGDKNLTEMPHSDTLNYYLERLSPNCLSQLRKKLIRRNSGQKEDRHIPMADQYRINRRECGRNGKCSQREMENHYLLTQMADIIMQIYLAWNPLRKEIKQSIKNTPSRFLESFRRQAITDEDVFYIQWYTTVYLE